MKNDKASLNRLLSHRSELPMALGCTACPDLSLCGGLKPGAGIFNCSDLCHCDTNKKKAACQYVCPHKANELARRYREIGGLDLSTVGHAPRLPVSQLPSLVPWIDGRGSLSGDLPLSIAAIPLRSLFRAKKGNAIDKSRASLATRFAIRPNTNLLVTGVSFEQPIEDYWGNARSGTFLDELAALQPTLVTTPNFSLFSDTPRNDNLYNMKRIAICWHELANRLIPTALHLNARTDHDWRRWGEFLTGHSEITSVAFEFATGAAPLKRSKWYLRQLVVLADNIGRPLQLIVRGGWSLLPILRNHFNQVVFIATDPLMRARKRRRLVLLPGVKPVWRRVSYIKNDKLDALFLQNVDAYNSLLANNSSCY